MQVDLSTFLEKKEQATKPVIVCLCGSTRFSDAFREANLRETLAGRIVLSIGCDTKSDADLALAGVEINKEALDTLHLFKIDLADEILVLNVGKYIGESTRREIEYARITGKRIRYLEPALSPFICAYHPGCSGQAEHQCPVCKKWYCAECTEMFLPIDPQVWAETAMRCPQCHYDGRGEFEREA